MIAKSLEGVAVITGAAGGIGQETAFAFAEAGARGVVLADINLQGAQEAAEKSKSYAKHPEFRALGMVVDVADPISVQAMVDAAIEDFGRIDYSVNSAGIANISLAQTADLPLEQYEKVNDINAKGTMLCLRAVSKAMSTQEPLTYQGRHDSRSLGRGSIVNLGSSASYMASGGLLSYTTSKHAVIGLTKSAAVDNLKYNIRVNAICPSWVDTPMMDLSFQEIPNLDKFVQTASPLGRLATAEELADVIVFMCSPSATYINGTGLLVDSGMSLTSHVGELPLPRQPSKGVGSKKQMLALRQDLT